MEIYEKDYDCGRGCIPRFWICDNRARWESRPKCCTIKATSKAASNEIVTGLLDRARKYIAQGNYELAKDQMEFCDSIDSGNKECQQVKQKAKRLDEELQDCARAGKNWVDDRCVKLKGNL